MNEQTPLSTPTITGGRYRQCCRDANNLLPLPTHGDAFWTTQSRLLLAAVAHALDTAVTAPETLAWFARTSPVGAATARRIDDLLAQRISSEARHTLILTRDCPVQIRSDIFMTINHALRSALTAAEATHA